MSDVHALRHGAVILGENARATFTAARCQKRSQQSGSEGHSVSGRLSSVEENEFREPSEPSVIKR